MRDVVTAVQAIVLVIVGLSLWAVSAILGAIAVPVILVIIIFLVIKDHQESGN